MSWKDRVRSQIKFISPSKKEFFGFWKGGSYGLKKRLGIFNYPKIDGAVVQDMGVEGTQYPITFYFTGDDHDLTAQDFTKTLKEIGQWQVVHPMYGVLILQPIDFSPKDEPLESGNVTEMTTNWIEVTPEGSIPSLSELSAGIKNQVYLVNETAAQQFNTVGVDTAKKKLAVKSEFEQFLEDTQKTIEEYSKKYAEANKQMSAIRRGITTAINQSTFGMASLAGQSQAMLMTPVYVTTDISGRLSAYSALTERIYTRQPTTTKVESKNTVMTQELTLSGVLSGIALTCISGEITTREDAITFIEIVSTLFINITNYLDESQELFQDVNLFDQYFSQSQSFANMQILIAKILAYLLRSLSDLSVAKKITLDRKRATIDVVIKEYGSLGENDKLYDFFIATNHLKGFEIINLPAGKEYVVYPGVA
jgi:hypothetical protein